LSFAAPGLIPSFSRVACDALDSAAAAQPWVVRELAPVVDPSLSAGFRSNADVMVDAAGRAFVMDFGVSRVVDSAVRTTILGHVQRGGTPTAYDRNLSTSFGATAAAMVASGQFGQMVAYQGGSFTSIELSEVANKTRTVPLSNRLLQSARALGTSFGRPDEMIAEAAG